MKSKRLLVLTLLPLLMTGCISQSPSGEDKRGTVIESEDGLSLRVTDMQNRSFTISKSKRERVICIGAGALRYYSYIGDVSKLVGVEEIDSSTTFGVGQTVRPYYMANYDTFSTLTIIGKGGPGSQKAEAEKLVAAEPDLIVSFLPADANSELAATIQTPVIGLSQGSDGVFDSITQKSLLMLGKIFDRETRANELINYVNTCKNEFANLKMTTETYYVGGIGNWGNTSLYGSFKKFPVLKYAKVKSAIDDTDFFDKDGKIIPAGQVTVDMDKLQGVNPDKIFLDTGGLNGFKADYAVRENKIKYDGLKAFENNETYLLMPYNAYYSNLEIQLMSTYYVASIAHSEFTLDLEAKMNEITNKFLGKNLYNEIKSHALGLGGYQKVDIRTL